MDGSNINVTGEELRQFIERAELIDAQVAELKVLRKEIFAEAKGRGYDVKVLRKVVSDRRKEREALAEFEAVEELYRSALGMA